MFKFNLVQTIHNQANRIRELEEALKDIANRHDNQQFFHGHPYACQCEGHRKAVRLLTDHRNNRKVS